MAVKRQKVPISYRIERETKQWLQEEAKRLERSESWLANKILTQESQKKSATGAS